MDVESVVSGIMSMNVEQVTKNEKKLIGKFPNTYTFTKNLAEKNLMKNRGNVRVVIHRPSIIASSIKQPFVGWTDSMSAAGGLTYLAGLGLLKLMPTSGKNRFDVIPADIVSNSILICVVNSAVFDIPFEVYNCGSSVQNPLTMKGYTDIQEINLQRMRFKDAIRSPGVYMTDNKPLYEFLKNTTERWPIQLISLALNLPFVGNH